MCFISINGAAHSATWQWVSATPLYQDRQNPYSSKLFGECMDVCMYVCLYDIVCMYTMMYNPSSRCSPFPRANSVTGRGVETQCCGGWGRPGREAKNKNNKLSPGAWKNRVPKNGCESTAGKGAEFCCRFFVVSNSSSFISKKRPPTIRHTNSAPHLLHLGPIVQHP